MFNRVIVIAGVPRSGTSWLGQIIDSSPNVAYRFQPLFSYAFKDALDMNSSREDYETFFQGIYKSDDEFLLQNDKRESDIYPEFDKKARNPKKLAFKTCRYQYLLIKMLKYFDRLKVVGIVRHPCGVINSWINNPKEYPKDCDPEQDWRFATCKNQGRIEEFFGFYKWKEVSHLYLDLKQKFPEQMYIIQYEDLVERQKNVAENLFDFLDLRFTRQTKRFLAESNSVHKDGPFSVYKDKSVKNKWKRNLDSIIANEIVEEVQDTRLERFLK